MGKVMLLALVVLGRDVKVVEGGSEVGLLTSGMTDFAGD